MRGNEFLGCGLSIRRHNFRLAMDDIVGAFVRRVWLAATRDQVLQQLNTGTRLRTKGRDSQMGSKYIIQVLLLNAVILALSGHLQSQQVAIELEARIGVFNNDRCVVDAEKEFV